MGNQELVDSLEESRVLRTSLVINAFRLVDRINFCIPDAKKHAYEDRPLPIYEGQTISQPTTVAMMTEALEVQPGQNVLEIGTGSGYQAAILSKIVGDTGKVYTIEYLHKLFEFAKENLKDYKNVYVCEGDGSKGLKDYAPFDRIIVTAGAPNVTKSLEEQLKINGKMIIPVGKDKVVYKMKVITKENNGVKEKSIGYFGFVPLVGEEGWKN